MLSNIKSITNCILNHRDEFRREKNAKVWINHEGNISFDKSVAIIERDTAYTQILNFIIMQ